MKSILALAALMASIALAGKSAYTVIVEETKIRKNKQFFAAAIDTVRYGDKVESAGEGEDGWLPVSVDGKDGWIHESAVSAKKVKAGSGKWQGSDDAAAEEVTLAGKGFNEDVEKAHRKASAAGNYEGVDAMLQRAISEKDLMKFMKKGATLPVEAQ